jgi:hypothetical protein
LTTPPAPARIAAVDQRDPIDNGANNAKVTASTDPVPVPGGTGSSANNTKTVAPNLDFTGVALCTYGGCGWQTNEALAPGRQPGPTVSRSIHSVCSS